jgi:hypothetical protein
MRITMTFQGGFVGTRCAVDALDESDRWETLKKIYPEDVNRAQVFDLPDGRESVNGRELLGLRFVFEESSDFFGRITIYDFQVEGIMG